MVSSCLLGSTMVAFFSNLYLWAGRISFVTIFRIESWKQKSLHFLFPHQLIFFSVKALCHFFANETKIWHIDGGGEVSISLSYNLIIVYSRNYYIAIKIVSFLGVTFAWLSTTRVIKYVSFHATMNFMCFVLINGWKRYTGKVSSSFINYFPFPIFFLPSFLSTLQNLIISSFLH